MSCIQEIGNECLKCTKMLGYIGIYTSNHITGQLSTQGNTLHTLSNTVNEEPKGHMNTQRVTSAGKQLRLHQHCSTSSAFRPMTVAHFHLHIMCNTQPLSHHTTHYWTYWTVEYTYSSSAHLVTDSRVQVELVNDQSDHISMAVLSCPVDHGLSTIVRAVEQ